MPESKALPSSKSNRRRLKLWLRIGVSATLLTVIYLAVDLHKLYRTLTSLSPASALLILALYAVGQVVSAFKWNLFVDQTGIKRPISEVVRAYFFGMFINSVGFGLGTVGGDLARGLALHPEKGQRTAALASVVADRIHGLGILLLIGTIAMAIVRPEPVSPIMLLLCALGVVGVGAAWLIGPWMLHRLIPEGHRFKSPAAVVMRAFPRKLSIFLSASLLSAIIHTLQISIHIVIARELGVALSDSYLFATVPLVNVASSLPISINGVGVREGMYAWLFSPYASSEVAVAFGAIWVVAVTIVGILGGLLLTPEMKESGALERLSREDDEREGTVIPVQFAAGAATGDHRFSVNGKE